MKKSNNKGFTLVELLAVIAVLAVVIGISIPVFFKVKETTLEKQFENVKTEIENKAEKYAKDTSVISMTVQNLIKEGYIEPDKGEDIINPVTKSTLNCKIIEVTNENGVYKAVLTDNGGTTEDGVCKDYIIKTDNSIKTECYSETNNALEIQKCNDSLKNTSNEWYTGSVKLSFSPADGKTVSKYRW
ncbi:MAG: type II secretion system protein, partial [Bacilli bacterium]